MANPEFNLYNLSVEELKKAIEMADDNGQVCLAFEKVPGIGTSIHAWPRAKPLSRQDITDHGRL